MIFYRLLRNKDVTITGSFTDVPNDAWYAQAVGVLSSLGSTLLSLHAPK